MSEPIYYLLNFLENEFQSFSEVRVRPVFKSGTTKSVDLVQEYDPEASNVHSRAGVTVMTKTKEFFFPVEWFSEPSRKQVLSQIQEIRELIES